MACFMLDSSHRLVAAKMLPCDAYYTKDSRAGFVKLCTWTPDRHCKGELVECTVGCGGGSACPPIAPPPIVTGEGGVVGR